MFPHCQLKLTTAESLLCRAISTVDEVCAADFAHQFVQFLGDENAYQMTNRNEVASHIAHRLLDSGTTDSIGEHWICAHEEIVNRISAYITELDWIAEQLHDAGISIVALKNSGILRGIYPEPACSPMGDIDVLVRKDDFDRAHQILISEGYHFEFRSKLEDNNIEAAKGAGGAEYYKILPNDQKMWFELQWRPVAGRWIRPDQEPSAEELVARSTTIPGSKVRLLSPEDNLLQVALHTAKHSYVRAPGFRLHTDVDRIVRFQKINWELFLKRVTDLHVKTGVYFSLAIPKQLFDTPIPDAMLDQLSPTNWKRQAICHFINCAGIFNPDQPKFGRIEYIVFTLLLYDNLGGIWKALFPSVEWMQERYQFQTKAKLPYYYAIRLVDLLFRRESQ